MKLPSNNSCDVLVAGGGIAGIMAAIKAASAGAAVTLVASGGLFSGSSFYPGTWGLGLIGPADDDDIEDLIASIQTVGCGMATQSLVDTFVKGISPAIEELRSMGMKLRRANATGEREFIPCFDHKHRDWNGIEFDSARTVLGGRLKELGVNIIEGAQILELCKDFSGRVCGAVAFYKNELCFFTCRAMVLATGGYGSVFKYHLCTEDVAGQGQALALMAGASLVNMEFMQMMPGYVSPAYKTIFNEKVFRFSRMEKPDGSMLFEDSDYTRRLLGLRSGHGPFTSRLDSKEVDIRLYRAFCGSKEGLRLTYSDEILNDTPEFIRTYFDWLKEAKGLDIKDPIHIGVFSHAANGGILIDNDAFTGVPGLYACGEVTGGMHGADRIGGLSTANGLVFGSIAGRAAAISAREQEKLPKETSFDGYIYNDVQSRTDYLRELMFKNAMIIRSEAGLRCAMEQIDDMLDKSSRVPSDDARAISLSRKFEGRLITSRAVLKAAYLRKESRGSHFREDYPAQDKEYDRQIILRKESYVGFD